MTQHFSSRVLNKTHVYLNLIRWDRPAGSFLLLWPTLSALWLSARGFPGWWLLWVFMAGTFLMRSAGCAINDVADQGFDRHVKRTANRPVTTGQLSSKEALMLAAVLAVLAFLLVLSTRWLTVQWSFAALAVAVIYPYAKRFVSMPQAVLGVAFSFGIPMAFTAVLDDLPQVAWLLLLGNLFWVLAYDTEYAMVDRDDDVRLGFHTSAITLGSWDVPAIMGFYLIYLGLWAWIGTDPRWGFQLGPWFLLGIAAALLQVIWHYFLIKDRTREGCFKAFRLNHWLGFSVFAGVVMAYLAPKLLAGW